MAEPRNLSQLQDDPEQDQPAEEQPQHQAAGRNMQDIARKAYQQGKGGDDGGSIADRPSGAFDTRQLPQQRAGAGTRPAERGPGSPTGANGPSGGESRGGPSSRTVAEGGGSPAGIQTPPRPPGVDTGGVPSKSLADPVKAAGGPLTEAGAPPPTPRVTPGDPLTANRTRTTEGSGVGAGGITAGDPPQDREDERDGGDSQMDRKRDEFADKAHDEALKQFQKENAERVATKAGERVAQRAILMNPYVLGAIGIALVVLMLMALVAVVIIGMAGSGDGAAENAGGGGERGGVLKIADISDVKIEKTACGSGSAPGGCYQLPMESKYYQIYGGGAAEHTGSKCLVQYIVATSKAWKEKYPNDTVFVGDLNAPGHASHSTGEDVDIHTARAANMTLPDYSPSRTVDYGKLWFSTKDIIYIFYNHSSVRDKVTQYSVDERTGGIIMPWPENAGDGAPTHHNHFHVRVDLNPDGSCKGTQS